MPPPHAPLIRALRAEDLPEALGLSTAAGWNQQIADWTMLRALAGDGAFAAESGSRVVGTALAIDYGRFAWIAMMLVTPDWRGQGLGRRLLDAALRTVPDGRPVRLDATEAGRPLYRSQGFEDEAALTRLVAPAARPAVATVESAAVRSITPADLPAIARRDAGVCGGDRRMVLEWALRAAPQYALIVDDARRPPQYCFGRTGRRFDQIGPVVAEDDAAAAALVGAGLAAAAGRLAGVDAFDARRGFARWLGEAGFAAERPLFRMRRPAGQTSASDVAPPAPWEYAICGPDLG